jgi:phosphoglycerate dehydrogenase-like enzyme
LSNVLITPRSLTKDGHPALDLLKESGHRLVFAAPGKQPSEEELCRLLPGCAGYLAGVEKISAESLESAGDLRVISRNGSGVDNIDLEAAKRLGIEVFKAEGANANGVAELTLGLIFSLTRAVAFHDQKMKNKVWERRKGIELAGRTLGLVGCGRIGKLVAGRALGLGLSVIAFDLCPDRSFCPSDKFSWISFGDVLKKADIISLHVPVSPGEKPVITEQVISKMKRGVYVINTSRAGLIDENAVIAALDDNHIQGLATDVYNCEPPDMLDLVMHNRVIATPHIGGFTEESIERATKIAVENLLKCL